MIHDGRYRRFSANRFELGLFGPNVQNGMARLTRTLWSASWDDNLFLARMAEDAGLEFVLPLGQWSGLRGQPPEGPGEGGAFETLTWASGIMAATQRIPVFGTLHVAYVNPVFAAKQCVTAHHIGHGRFGLNVVSGTVTKDFAMFGLTPGDHDTQYDYTEEWLTIAKRIWSEPEPFDYDGTYFHLKHVLGKPKPYGGTRPMLISAGHSLRGREFAMRHADALFTSITELENAAEEIRVARSLTEDAARIPVYASGHMICRPTRKEADEYFHYLVHELGDWNGLDAWIERLWAHRTMPYKSVESYKERLITGLGTFLVKGSYDDAAQTFSQLHDAGIDGMAVAFVDYLSDVPGLCHEIVPRLERLGLRQGAATLTTA